jgi:DNA-binding response OmpR family regulator
LRTHKILVVDDDSALRDLIACAFKDFGFDTVEANNGEEAWALIESGNFAAIVSDVIMKPGTGLQLLAKVREKNLSIVFILCTAYSDTIKAKAEDLGVDGIFMKPFPPNQLVEFVKARLGKGRDKW